MRTLLILSFLLGAGCAAKGIPIGTYEAVRQFDDATEPTDLVRHVITFVFLLGPLDSALFPMDAAEAAEHLDVEEGPRTCVIMRAESLDGSFLESVSFAAPEPQSGKRFRIRSLETHHYTSWFELTLEPGILRGAFLSRGFGGPSTEPVEAFRVGDGQPATCIDAIRRILSDLR